MNVFIAEMPCDLSCEILPESGCSFSVTFGIPDYETLAVCMRLLCLLCQMWWKPDDLTILCFTHHLQFDYFFHSPLSPQCSLYCRLVLVSVVDSHQLRCRLLIPGTVDHSLDEYISRVLTRYARIHFVA